MHTFRCMKKRLTKGRENYFNLCLRRSRGKVGGKSWAWFSLNVMRYCRESCQSVCTLVILDVSQHSVESYLREGKTLNEKSRLEL